MVARLVNQHVGHFNHAGWARLQEKHGNNLPLLIRSVPEGTIVPPGNVLMTVENTDEEFPWLTNYVETLLTHLWYPTTVATQSRWMKQRLLDYLEQTGTPEDIDFKLHDFGYRGCTCHEQAEIGGMSHLVNFKGTDTFPGVLCAMDNYDAEMPGFSIPASEHSTITSWGRDNECEAMENMLDVYPTGPMACVSDSYDIFRACSKYWGDTLKEKVLRRDGLLVIRPDSGDPLEVVPQVLGLLGQAFGQETNSKGFNVLHPKVRVIQGDGIDRNSMCEILDSMRNLGWSADNIAFGSGGGLLQKLDRDTCRFAFKCSAIKRAGVWHDVYKEPITDSNKNSKRGRLKLINDGQFKTVSIHDEGDDLLQTVFENGVLYTTNFADVRRRAV